MQSNILDETLVNINIKRYLNVESLLGDLVTHCIFLFTEKLCFTEEVKEALTLGKPVVALESTIITHGMPYPDNAQ